MSYDIFLTKNTFDAGINYRNKFQLDCPLAPVFPLIYKSRASEAEKPVLKQKNRYEQGCAEFAAWKY